MLRLLIWHLIDGRRKTREKTPGQGNVMFVNVVVDWRKKVIIVMILLLMVIVINKERKQVLVIEINIIIKIIQ